MWPLSRPSVRGSLSLCVQYKCAFSVDCRGGAFRKCAHSNSISEPIMKLNRFCCEKKEIGKGNLSYRTTDNKGKCRGNVIFFSCVLLFGNVNYLNFRTYFPCLFITVRVQVFFHVFLFFNYLL